MKDLQLGGSFLGVTGAPNKIFKMNIITSTKKVHKQENKDLLGYVAWWVSLRLTEDFYWLF